MKVRELIRLVEQDGTMFVQPEVIGTSTSHQAGNGYDPRTLKQGYPGRHSKQCDETSGVEMIEERKYAVVFERSEDGYGAFVPDFPGCITVGNTLEETE